MTVLYDTHAGLRLFVQSMHAMNTCMCRGCHREFWSMFTLVRKKKNVGKSRSPLLFLPIMILLYRYDHSILSYARVGRQSHKDSFVSCEVLCDGGSTARQRLNSLFCIRPHAQVNDEACVFLSRAIYVFITKTYQVKAGCSVAAVFSGVLNRISTAQSFRVAQNVYECKPSSARPDRFVR